MTEITFGRYTPFNTVVHRIDARNKILLVILALTTIFLQFNMWSSTLILSGVYLILIIVAMIISKVSFVNLFKSLAGMWFLVLFLLIIYIFIPNSTYKHEAFRINNFIVYWDAFYQCAYIVLRLVMVLSLTTILTSTTKPLDLTYAFEWYMTPLKFVHFPSHEIAMTLSIALRFIPTLLEETERIQKAQASRGIDFTRGSFFKRIKAVVSLIIPLFISSIEKSEELANAMEARGYDPKGKRSRYREYHFHLSDLFSLIVVLAIFGGVLTLFFINRDIDIVNVLFPQYEGF